MSPHTHSKHTHSKHTHTFLSGCQNNLLTLQTFIGALLALAIRNERNCGRVEEALAVTATINSNYKIGINRMLKTR